MTPRRQPTCNGLVIPRRHASSNVWYFSSLNITEWNRMENSASSSERLRGSPAASYGCSTDNTPLWEYIDHGFGNARPTA
ncbi:hypothetical protein Dda_7477 [Drechslerella dactyloides]|uniref:Uncharacterized protein n=1 Tax=Drechslerella dactyloides TaxID=74499 RepID=A0AAD6ITF5_DREDA|nr:hypothetical protein Dda_7477 [Drechslerella dactyloides]